MKNCWCWVIVFAVSVLNVQAQTQLKGRIFDAVSGLGVPDAEISIPAMGLSARSSANGTFQFEMWTYEGKYLLRISHPAYQTLEIESTSISSVQIFLNPKERLLNEVRVTAFKHNQSIQEVPAAVSKLARKELEQNNQSNIAPALNRIPGVHMQSGALNTNRITIRGVGSRSRFATANIRAYLNEIPLTEGNGETALEDINLDLIESVEVIKGAASSLYGVGLGGTILMESKKPNSGQSNFSAEAGLASFGLFRSSAQATLSQRNGEWSRFSALVQVSTTTSEGYRANNEYDRRNANIFFQFLPNQKNHISLLVSSIELDAFIPSSLSLEDFENNPENAAFIWQQVQGNESYEKFLAGLSWTHYFSSTWKLTNSLYGNFRSEEELSPFEEISLQQRAGGLRSVFSYQKNNLDLVFGTELFTENRDGRSKSSSNDQSTSFLIESKSANAFGQLDYRLQNWVASLGLNANYSVFDRPFLRTVLDKSSTLSPRGSIGRLFSENNHLLFLGFSHGFNPAANIVTTYTARTELKPEEGWNFEFGGRGAFEDLNLNYDWSVYYLKMSNLINSFTLEENGPTQYENIGESEHPGLELAVNWESNESEGLISRKSLGTNFAYMPYTFGNFRNGDKNFDGNELTGVPKTTANVNGSLAFNFGLNLNLNFTSIGKQALRDDNAVFSEAYRVLDLHVSQSFDFGKSWSIDLKGGINNLFDEKYASMFFINAFGNATSARYYYPGLPRNYYGMVRLNYLVK